MTQSHKWLRTHKKPSADPVGSVVSVATRCVNAEQSASSWKVAEPRKRVERVRGQPRESARTKLQQEDQAQ